MQKFTHTSGIAPLAMSLAVAAFLAAGTAATPGFAQEKAKQAATNPATSMKPETVDQRIAQLRRDLKITQSQESDWRAVADAMKANADDMHKLVEQTRSEAPKAQRTAVEDLETYRKFAQAHADGLQKLTEAFTALYNAMTPEQKANADQVFRNFEHQRPRSQS